MSAWAADGGFYKSLYGLGFRTGDKLCFFSQSLYWLVRYAGLAVVGKETMKDGEPMLYGEMTHEELVRLVQAGRLRRLRFHDWGVSWPFKDQPQGANDDFSDFPAWRDSLLALPGREAGLA